MRVAAALKEKAVWWSCSFAVVVVVLFLEDMKITYRSRCKTFILKLAWELERRRMPMAPLA